jgi:DNA-binding Xre family transcriptional regulator
MTLNEFINKRLSELGITRSQLCSAGLSWATLSKIKNGGNNISVPVKEKLAIGLKCTIGDINACLSETDDPRRKDGPEGKHKPITVMETVDKLEQMVASDPEEEPHLYNVKHPTEEEPPVKVPVKVEALEPDEDTDSMVLAVEEYKDQLRGQIIKHMMEAEPGTTVETLWIRIGQMVVKDVL